MRIEEGSQLDEGDGDIWGKRLEGDCLVYHFH